MTVKVFDEYGNYREFENAGSFDVDEFGRLYVEGVAVFADNRWDHAEVVDEDPKEPRVWSSLADVPRGVTVYSGSAEHSVIDGSPPSIRITSEGEAEFKWAHDNNWCRWLNADELKDVDSVWGPYIEVVE